VLESVEYLRVSLLPTLLGHPLLELLIRSDAKLCRDGNGIEPLLVFRGRRVLQSLLLRRWTPNKVVVGVDRRGGPRQIHLRKGEEKSKLLFPGGKTSESTFQLLLHYLDALLTIAAWLTTPPDVAKVCTLLKVFCTANNPDSTSVASSSGRNSIQGYDRCHSYHCS